MIGRTPPAPVAAVPMTPYKNKWVGIARFGGVGDNLMVASPLKLLKQKFGHVEVLTCPPQHVVFENNPFIDKICVTDKQYIPMDTPENWQNWFRGKAQEFEAYYHLSHSCETMLALFPGQTHFWWPASFRRKFCARSYLEVIHDICEVPYEFGPLFFATDEEKVKALETKQKIGTPCIGWVIGGTRIDKVHPYSGLIIARLVKEVAPVVMFGAPGRDFEIARTIQQDVIKHNGNDAGLHLALSPDPNAPSWPIRRIISQVHTCEVVIGPDTGPMWGTAFEPNAKIMLLSHASPENITKYWVNTTTLHADPVHVPCWPCHQLHDDPKTCTPNADRSGAACITDISTQVIIEKVMALLDQRTQATPSAPPAPTWPTAVGVERPPDVTYLTASSAAVRSAA